MFGALGVALLLAAWQICAVTGAVDVHISSDPSQVAQEEVTLFGNGTIWGPIGNTAAEVGWALAIIIVAGIPLAGSPGCVRWPIPLSPSLTLSRTSCSCL